MKITDLLSLGGVLIPFLFFASQSLTKQYDNVKNHEWEKLIKWLMVLITTVLFTYIIIKAEFEELASINTLNNYGIFLFAFGLGLFVSGGYDSIKDAINSKKFQGELEQVVNFNIEDVVNDED